MKIFLRCMVFAVLVLLAVNAPAAENIVLSGKLYCPVVRTVLLPFAGILGKIEAEPGAYVKTDDILIRYKLEENAANALEKELALGAGTEALRGQIVDLERQTLALKGEIATSRQLVSSRLGSRDTLLRQEETLDALNRRSQLLRESATRQEAAYALRLAELENLFHQPVKGLKPPQELLIVSPMDGYVLSLADNVRTDALLSAGSPLIEIGSMNPMQVRVQIFENEAVRLKVGDGASVRFPSLQDREYMGKVTQISWTPQTLQADSPSYYSVQLEVSNPDLSLKQGFKALVRFSDLAATDK